MLKDVVVLDNGGTRIRIGHIASGHFCQQFETHSSQLLCVPNAKKILLNLIRAYIKRHNLSLSAAVLGIPAMLDRHNDGIAQCNNIPQLEGYGLGEYLRAELGCPVHFEQDIMLQLLGEWRAGVAQEESTVFGMYFGTGIGAAWLVDGNPDNPRTQDIQAGHIPVMAEGRLCKCGNRGCVEAYASGHTLVQLAAAEGCPVEQLFEQRNRTEQSDTLAMELDKFLLYQAYALATVATLLKPNLIVIGGGIPLMRDYPRDELLAKANRHLQSGYPFKRTRFRWASLGSHAVLYGALALLERANPP